MSSWIQAGAVVIVLLSASVSEGAPPGPYVAMRIDYHRDDPEPADGTTPTKVGEQRGSGVVVGQDDARTWLVLTNAHVVEVDPEIGRAVPLVFAGGDWRKGRIVAEDSAADLALVRISFSNVLQSAPVARTPPQDRSEVTTHGFSGGTRFYRRETELRHALPLPGGSLAWAPDRYFVKTTFHPGESGGAVTLGGKLVGLIHGNDPAAEWGLIVDFQAIQTFLEPLLPEAEEAVPATAAR